MVLDARAQALSDWVKDAVQRQPSLGQWQAEPHMISGDASFRRYFRLHTSTQSLIAVDAPVASENNLGFVAIARGLAVQGVHVPQVLDWSEPQGFMLLSDLGDALLLPALKAEAADRLYSAALHELLPLQGCQTDASYPLPTYDAAKLLAEMRLLSEWFVPQYLEIDLAPLEVQVLEQQFAWLVKEIEAQPRVFVHRDYHSRNLMLCANGQVGVIDFQDGVIGPITYDLISLLRDAYICWPSADVQRWQHQFYAQLQAAGRLDPSVSEATFDRWCDLMAAQRHIKVLGIFARLYLRDGKPGYLKDMPLVYRYLCDEIAAYPELAPLQALLKAWLPIFERINGGRV